MFNPVPLPDSAKARLFSLVVAVGLLASSCLIPGEALAQERKVFVEEGEPVAVASGPWEMQDGYLAVGSTGEDAGLYAGQELGTGDFHIRARLRIPAFFGSGTAFQMGESYFGFDGPNRTLCLAGRSQAKNTGRSRTTWPCWARATGSTSRSSAADP